MNSVDIVYGNGLAEHDLLPSICLSYLGLSLLLIIRWTNVLLHIDNFLIFFFSTYGNKHTFLRSLFISRWFYFQKGECLHLEMLNNCHSCVSVFIDFICENYKLFGNNLSRASYLNLLFLQINGTYYSKHKWNFTWFILCAYSFSVLFIFLIIQASSFLKRKPQLRKYPTN